MLEENEGKNVFTLLVRVAIQTLCVLEYIPLESIFESLMLQDNIGKETYHYARESKTADTLKCILRFASP